MAIYMRNFKKTVWGYQSVNADSPEEAQEETDNGNEDETDIESDYKFEEWKLNNE